MAVTPILGGMPADRLERQLAFVREIDKAKGVLRQNPLSDDSRRENDAEHMWHLSVMAMVLAEHATETVDLLRVLRMLLIHDIVEIDAGDTFVYDDAAREGKQAREREAAERIFGILPEDQGAELRDLWEEFEARATPEARFAVAVDRLLPMMLNHASGGGAWSVHGITNDRVRARNEHIAEVAPDLWEAARALIDDAVARGILG